MKKNISINISGIIFHIEEDGYDTLRKYLDSINKYFSSFEDSSEILADIESRIAEIFLSKLNEGKQVITFEDVNSLIATMGSVSDFKAAEEQEVQEETARPSSEEQQKKEEPKSESYRQSKPYTQPKRLYRDQKRKILGGVCAGLGNYFNIDSVWIRLFFALFTAAYGVGFVVYVVLWIAVPGSFELDEPEVEKKLFRDTEHKVLAGVSGGLAAYFGFDIVAIRVLFVVFTFAAGTGLLIYLVLWIVLPEARSLTDRMQMQGEPVTLSNIESNIKKNLNEKDGEEESAFMKILLLPFRIIAALITALGKILGPLVEVVRVAIGLVVFFIGLALVISVFMSTGVLFGIFSGVGFPVHWEGREVSELSIPIHAFTNAFPTWTVVAAFFGSIIPCIFLLLLGISIIAKRIVFNAAVGWSMFVVFFLSVAALSIGIPRIVYSFKEEGEYKIENTYHITGQKAILKINETGLDDYDVVSLNLKGSHDKDFRLVQSFEAQGPTRLKAIENAQMVDYAMNFQDSVFTFDSNVHFKDNAVFRAQRLRMTLYIPYNTPFVIDDGMYRIINQYLDWNIREGNTWMMTEQGLKCTTCPVEEKIDRDFDNEDDTEFGSDDQYGMSNFDELNVSGFMDLRITQGDEYAVELIGPEDEKNRYEISQRGQTLYIKYEDERKFTLRNFDFDEMRINITMPSISKLDLRGAGDVYIRNFNEDEANIEVLGVLKVHSRDFVCRDLTLRLNGASEMDLSGSGTNLEANVQGASKLNAYDYRVRDAVVTANGASRARVYVTNRLEMDESVASDIDYQGHPTVIKRD